MAATTKPLPAPPFVDVPGLPNFRDCGGYPVANSNNADSKPQRIIRRGVLFRASEPSKLTDEGIAILRDTLRITHVYDLRSKLEIDGDAELDGRQPREWDGAQRIFAPVFLEEDYSPEGIAKRYGHFTSEEVEVSRHGFYLHFSVPPTLSRPSRLPLHSQLSLSRGEAARDQGPHETVPTCMSYVNYNIAPRIHAPIQPSPSLEVPKQHEQAPVSLPTHRWPAPPPPPHSKATP